MLAARTHDSLQGVGRVYPVVRDTLHPFLYGLLRSVFTRLFSSCYNDHCPPPSQRSSCAEHDNTVPTGRSGHAQRDVVDDILEKY